MTLYLASVLNGTHRFVAFNVVRTTVFVGNAAGLVALAIASELTVTSAMFAYLASSGADRADRRDSRPALDRFAQPP